MSCSPPVAVFRRALQFLAPLSVSFLLPLHIASAQNRAAIPQNTNPPAARKPCIILIVANDLGCNDLGCYGQTRIKTPNIDKLAAEGMRFNNFYAGSPIAAASRAVIMTGRDSGHARIRGNNNAPLQPEDVSIAMVLRQDNYRTAAMGVWGMGPPGSTGLPFKKGFLEWFGYTGEYEAQNPYPEYLDRVQLEENNGTLHEHTDPNPSYANDRFTQVALTYLNQTKPAFYNQYRPFFLYLPYSIPRAGGEPTGPAAEGEYVSQRWPQPEKIKAAMISRLDSYVGQITNFLKHQTNELNTVIILISTRGTQAGGGVDPKFFDLTGSRRGAAGDLYEGGLRVPLIVRWPLQMKAGTTSDLPCAAWDLLPTIADMANRPVPTDIEGISLLPTLLGGAQTNRHESFYWEAHDHTFQQAVRSGDWKAVRPAAGKPLELYDLKTDPAEKTDVADKNPEAVARLEALMKSSRSDDPTWPIEKSAASMKKEGGG